MQVTLTGANGIIEKLNKFSNPRRLPRKLIQIGNYLGAIRNAADHGPDVRISMSRRGNVYDNARAESFIKTLKYEEVYRTEYRNLEEAKASIKIFLEKIYNQERLHAALGYRPPVEFEQSLSVLSRGKRGAAA